MWHFDEESSEQRSDRPSTVSTTMLEQLRALDPRAWDRLETLYGPVIYQYCRRAGLQPNDAADLMQEVLMQVCKSLPQFQRTGPGHTFRGWLWTITRNKVRDHFRRRAGQPLATGGTDALHRIQQLPATEAAAEPEPSETDFHRAALRRALELVKQEFTQRTRKAFWETAVLGRSAPEVAAELGMSKAAVRKAKSRVLARLRQLLD